MVEIEIFEHDGSNHLLVARDWIQMIHKIHKYLVEADITFPVGEDEKIKMVTRKLKEIDKHY